jgi:nucleoid DNA-binding protein
VLAKAKQPAKTNKPPNNKTNKEKKMNFAERIAKQRNVIETTDGTATIEAAPIADVADAASAPKAKAAPKAARGRQKSGDEERNELSRAREYKTFIADVDPETGRPANVFGPASMAVEITADSEGARPIRETTVTKKSADGKERNSTKIEGSAVFKDTYLRHMNATVVQRVLGAPLKLNLLEAILSGIAAEDLDLLVKGYKLKKAVLGMLHIQTRPARKGRDIRSNKETVHPAARTLKFKVSPAVKKDIKDS